MREIIFKAKRLDNGEWVEGDLVSYGYVSVIRAKGVGTGWNIVDSETVCQFTGRRDKNGERIFEGDEFNGSWGGIEIVPYFVKFEKGAWKDNMGNHNIYDADWIVVTGNIHDGGKND